MGDKIVGKGSRDPGLHPIPGAGVPFQKDGAVDLRGLGLKSALPCIPVTVRFLHQDFLRFTHHSPVVFKGDLFLKFHQTLQAILFHLLREQGGADGRPVSLLPQSI